DVFGVGPWLLAEPCLVAELHAAAVIGIRLSLLECLIMFFAVVWTLLADVRPEPPIPTGGDLVKYVGIGCGVLAVLFMLMLMFRRKKKHDPEGGLGEDLGEYPPPPKAGKRRLLVQGNPMRLRLVVVAPVGKKEFAKD